MKPPRLRSKRQCTTVDKDNGNEVWTSVRRTRKEFSQKVKVAAFARSRGFCECDNKCGTKLFPGNIRYNHRIPDELDGEPTLENCQVLSRACDREVTKRDQRDIGRARRVHAGHISAKAPPRRPMPGTRASGWKKTFSNGWVRRNICQRYSKN